ncbi:uncharacterized protein LOC123519965 [Portunus trituberculatus]|uniref:uncharacterized protein LOC123519965 n=1 Tax=Portunus trituberculatus TaxID=210409 RepID=UPI001E1D21A2|nr:uncharacterized protein LOC123519965 [Portunus trituberculatus]
MATSPGATMIVTVAVTLLAVYGVTAGPLNSVHGDLCKKMNGRRYYLEANTKATLTAVNVTLPRYPRLVDTEKVKVASLPFHRLPLQHRRTERDSQMSTTTTTTTTSASAPAPDPLLSESTPPSSPMHHPHLEEEEEGEGAGVAPSMSEPFRCGAEFFTCPECHLEFKFGTVNLPSCSHDHSCRCDYVRIREPPYTGGGGGRDVCSTGGPFPPSFATQTREVIVDFLYATRHAHAFSITVTARRNKYRITEEVNKTRGYISSPFFPELYPKEHWMEYRLEAQHPDGRIKVNFLDFLLSPWSFVEVEDTNKTRVGVFSGALFRPPILVSSGPHLTVRFNGNGETARGFNLQYSFVSAGSPESKPAVTDCGGIVTNFGGTITMMNMARGERNFTVYDCVWIFQPPRNYAFKSHMSIRLVQFEDVVAGSQLEIRQGLTSRDYLMETVVAGKGKAPKGNDHGSAADTGFYVRLRGAFTQKSKLAIVYSAYSYIGTCYPVTDFLCQNHRCIPKMLGCDGFDHCGDGSDEPSSCYLGPGNKSLTPQDAAWWYQNTPNYYFPQKNNLMSGGPHGWSTLISFLAMITVILIMFALLSNTFRVRMHSNNSGHRERRSGERNSREASLSDGVEIFDASADDPPLYEPPPDYEEVVKLILSGNNLKLVRRPGGVTAWVPDKGDEGGSSGNTQTWTPDGRPTRTRHASLDLERGVEVVLWDANGFPRLPRRGPSDAATAATVATNATAATTTTTTAATNRPRPMTATLPGHIRRSSLPAPPQPEVIRAHVQGHGVSMAPETITEAPEGLDSPAGPLRTPRRAAMRAIQPALSSPSLSMRSFQYDSSAPSTPRPTPRGGARAPRDAAERASRMAKRGRRRKKTSTLRETRPARSDEAAPPSYEGGHGGQPCLHARPLSPAPVAGPSSAPALAPAPSSLVSESTQTSLDQEDVAPTERLRAARNMFQRMSREADAHVHTDTPAPRPVSAPAHSRAPATAQASTTTATPSPAPRPSVRAPARRSLPPHHGGTISRGTVKARTAMLLRSRVTANGECECSGACSCGHARASSSRRGGAVRSRVNYYLAVQEAAVPEGPPPHLPPDAAAKKRRIARPRSLPAHAPRPAPPAPRPVPSPVSPVQQTAASPMEEDHERPLLPLASPEEAPDGVLPCIKDRVLLYDDLTRTAAAPFSAASHSPKASPSTVFPGHRSPSPKCPSPRSPSPRTPSPALLDSPVRPGLVRDTKNLILSALRQDAPPRQDREPRVPYLRLRSEDAATPEGEAPLSPPPLREDQAQSIEMWDACWQGGEKPPAPDRQAPLPQPRARDTLRLELNKFKPAAPQGECSAASPEGGKAQRDETPAREEPVKEEAMEVQQQQQQQQQTGRR